LLGSEAPSRTVAFDRVKKFRSGETEVEDNPKGRPPRKGRTDENIVTRYL
jgi:hypothetical protein